MADVIDCGQGEKLSEDERAIFAKLTGREREPLRPVEEMVAVVGRRGGKSRALATFAAYIGGLAEHPSLVPGERGLVLCIAPDTRQAGIALKYSAAVFEQSPILRSLIVGRTTDTLSLSNGVDPVRSRGHEKNLPSMHSRSPDILVHRRF